LKRGRSASALGRGVSTRDWAVLRLTIRSYVRIAALVIIVVVVIIVIALAPLGMAALAKGRENWPLLANVGQAYGGISALISAIALVGVIGALLIQTNQHRLDRLTAIRGRQAQIYSVARENPKLYYPVLGMDFQDEGSMRRRMFRLEALQYFATGFETGLLTKEILRRDAFAGFFRYEENRQFWEMASSDWLVATPGRKRRKFVKIVNKELAHAKSIGPGLPLPQLPDDSRNIAPDRRLDWRLSIFAGVTAGIGIGFLLSRRRS
jgi:Family of unknown function (DUF6082)